MQYLTQLLISGLAIGAIYGLIAMGFAVIYKSTGLVNFAQGEMTMITAYIAWTISTSVSGNLFVVASGAIIAAIVLGLVIERVSGKGYADYLKQEVFEPAGLQATRYCPDEQNYPGAAQGYDREQNVLEPSGPISMSLPFSAGALCSTAPDLVRWLEALSHGKVISSDAFARMSAPTPLPEGPSRYGLGLSLEDLRGHAMLGHGGGITEMVSRRHFVAHTPGFRWLDASTAGEFATDAELALAANWNAVYSSIKSTKFVAIRTTEA